jgi:RimJ/RimL family protein N-acetyltransferase
MTDFGDVAIATSTPRVVIRPWHLDEADRAYDMYRRMEVVEWFPNPPLRTRAEAVALIERWAAGLAADPRFGFWAAVERASGIPAGTVVLKPLPNGDGEIEIGLASPSRQLGKGIASEAAGALLQRGFAHGLDEVWAVTHPDNRRSIGVCQRIGMRLLGVTERWYHEPSLMFWRGVRADQQPSLSPDEPPP